MATFLLIKKAYFIKRCVKCSLSKKCSVSRVLFAIDDMLMPNSAMPNCGIDNPVLSHLLKVWLPKSVVIGGTDSRTRRSMIFMILNYTGPSWKIYKLSIMPIKFYCAVDQYVIVYSMLHQLVPLPTIRIMNFLEDF